MANLFLGFPVPRAKIASMIEGTAPPSEHHTQHELGGSDEMDCTGLGGAGGVTFPLADFWLDDHRADAGNWQTAFTGTGALTRSGDRLTLKSGVNGYSTARVKLDMKYPIPTMSWDKKRHLIIRCKPVIPTIATNKIQIITGEGTNTNHMGFWFQASTLYGHNGVSGQQDYTVLKTYTDPAEYVEMLLEAILFPGEKIEYWIDGVLLGTSTEDLPSGAYYARDIANLWASNEASGVDCKLEFNHIQVYQEG